jgi:type IV pilus assembly protein PilW
MQAMTRARRQLAVRPALGFSLIELMVSLTIGLVIAIAAMSAYVGASSSSKIADAQSRMNEDAQAALAVLSQQIRMADNNPIQPNRADDFKRNPVYGFLFLGGTITPYSTSTYTTSYALSNFAVRGCDGTFNNIKTANTIDGLDISTCATGTSTTPDSIAISYEADVYNTIKSASPIKPTDCLGNRLQDITATFSLGTATTATYYVAESRFFIGTSTTIVSPSLYCKGNVGTNNAQPLVENIEDMQITYGTVSTSATETAATVAGYLRADEISALVTTPADAQTRWGKAATVRICILVRSEDPVASNADAARYDDCHGNRNRSAPDLRLRRAYSTTVTLRNRRN